jgi:hypothetical protein
MNQPLIQGGPIDGSPMNAPQAPQTVQSTANMQSMIPQGNETMESKLMNSIGKLDIDNKNIPMNQLGKMLLQQRLKNRWGDDFRKNSDVSKVLGEFDKALGFYSDDASKTMNEMMNKTNMTLQALKG